MFESEVVERINFLTFCRLAYMIILLYGFLSVSACAMCVQNIHHTCINICKDYMWWESAGCG